MALIETSNKVFGARSNANASSSNGFVKDPNWVPATYYMNIGQTIELVDDASGEIVTKFVSLPQGLGLDNMARRDVTKGTEVFRMEQDARNGLLDDILEVCKDMEPGEDRIITLEVQLHRVKEAAPIVKSSDNPFRQKLRVVTA